LELVYSVQLRVDRLNLEAEGQDKQMMGAGELLPMSFERHLPGSPLAVPMWDVEPMSFEHHLPGSPLAVPMWGAEPMSFGHYLPGLPLAVPL
jgi:hypothetical protein